MTGKELEELEGDEGEEIGVGRSELEYMANRFSCIFFCY